MQKKPLGLAVIGVALVAGLWFLFFRAEPDVVAAGRPAEGDPMVAIGLPEISGNELIGKNVFDAKCASCHGENATGKYGLAPPLVHKIYEPSHHGDMAFVRAAQLGVKSHHWKFGDMPPVDGVTEAEVAYIIAYVRTLQRANGIN